MSDKFGEGRDPYLYPGLDIMRNRLNIRQQQRLERPLPHLRHLRRGRRRPGRLRLHLPRLPRV